MELKPGYKRTEIGTIPEDWEVKLLPDVCRFRGGKAHEQHISEFGRYVCVNSKFISTDGRVRKYSTVNFCAAKRYDILMVMSDLPNGRALAKAYFADQDDLYAVNQRVCALTAYSDCPEYLFYVLNRNPYFLKFNDGVNQTHLLNHVFQRCAIPLPPTKAEQQSIAAALSDVDALVGSLDKLIAKKRDIKQAAIQQLLTGKRRLPGFSGDWEIVDFASIVRDGPKNGYSGAAATDALGTLTLRLTATTSGHFTLNDGSIKHLAETIPSGSDLFLRPGDVLIQRSNTIDLVGTTGIYDGPPNKYVYPDLMMRVRFHNHAAARWFMAYANSHLGRRFFVSAAAGSTGSMPKISGTTLRKMPVPLPSPQEQEAIVAVLSDMDAEIAALEARRDKTKLLKQGMMQELLTGRIRLV